MTSIEAEALTLRRPAGFTLGPLDLRVAGGSRAAVVGPSGCGKTTLLRCLAGLEPPASGTVRFAGELVDGAGVRVPPSARGIGFVFQDGALWPHLTAERHLTFVDPSLGRAGARALLDRVGLLPLADRRPAELSGGEAQRLALARALAGRPRVLLLDEPLRSVDVHLRDELALLILDQVAERALTLVVVTHDREEALGLADELVVMRAGRVVEAGTAEALLQEPGTAYTAAFLCGALCLPATSLGDGTFDTALGRLPGPDANGPLSLVLLPGDARIEGPAREGAPVAVVQQVWPGPGGRVAALEVQGHPLRLPCPAVVAPGDRVALGLAGAPRFLPADGGRR